MNLLKNQVKKNPELETGEVVVLPKKGIMALFEPYLDPKDANDLFKDTLNEKKKQEDDKDDDKSDNDDDDDDDELPEVTKPLNITSVAKNIEPKKA